MKTVSMFSGETQPLLCQCKHERNGTGIFYSSIKAINCTKCKGWQPMDKPIDF